MIKKTATALAILTLLAGCASPNEMRQRIPDLQLESVRKANTVATCIADIWENNGGNGGTIAVTMRETQSGYTVAVPCSPTTCLLADITIQPDNHSKTTIFKGGPAVIRGDYDMLDYAKSCQNP